MCEPRSQFFAPEWASNYEKFRGKDLNLVKQMQTISKHMFALYVNPVTVQHQRQKLKGSPEHAQRRQKSFTT